MIHLDINASFSNSLSKFPPNSRNVIFLRKTLHKNQNIGPQKNVLRVVACKETTSTWKMCHNNRNSIVLSNKKLIIGFLFLLDVCNTLTLTSSRFRRSSSNCLNSTLAPPKGGGKGPARSILKLLLYLFDFSII